MASEVAHRHLAFNNFAMATDDFLLGHHAYDDGVIGHDNSESRAGSSDDEYAVGDDSDGVQANGGKSKPILELIPCRAGGDSRVVLDWGLESNKEGKFTLVLYTQRGKFPADELDIEDRIDDNEETRKLAAFLRRHTYWVRCKESKGVYQLWDGMILSKAVDFPKAKEGELETRGFVTEDIIAALLTPSAFCALAHDHSRRPYTAIKVFGISKPIQDIRHQGIDWNLVPGGQPLKPSDPNADSYKRRRVSLTQNATYVAPPTPHAPSTTILPLLGRSPDGSMGHAHLTQGSYHPRSSVAALQCAAAMPFTGNEQLSTLISASMVAACSCLKLCTQLAAENGEPLHDDVAGQEIVSCIAAIDGIVTQSANDPLHSSDSARWVAMADDAASLTHEAHHLKRCAEGLHKRLANG